VIPHADRLSGHAADHREQEEDDEREDQAILDGGRAPDIRG
jgi:hypothetical protein